MPKFRFIGDPNDNFSGPNVLEMFGVKFPRDEWVEVAEGPLAEKLGGNSHFDADYGMNPAVAANADRSSLIAEAEALGVKVDGRWSNARLETEISTAKIRAAE